MFLQTFTYVGNFHVFTLVAARGHPTSVASGIGIRSKFVMRLDGFGIGENRYQGQ